MKGSRGSPRRRRRTARRHSLRSPRSYLHWLEEWKPLPRLTLPRLLSVEATAALTRHTPEQKRWIEERTHPGAPDLRTLASHADAVQWFGQELQGRPDVNDALLVRTFVRQLVLRMLRGEERPIQGNLRSMWYRELSPLAMRLGLLDPDAAVGMGAPSGRARYLLDLMEQAFEEMFLAGFFRYADLEVYDSRENFRKVGPSRKGVPNRRRFVLHTEKEGLYRLLEVLSEEFGISIFASRGSPTWVAVDYFADELRRHGSNLVVATLTDYDPWGADIAEQLAEKLRTHPTVRFKSVGNSVLTDLSIFDPARIHQVKRQLLPPGPPEKAEKDPRRTIVEEWLKAGGGVPSPQDPEVREAYGLHVDNAEPHLIKERVARWIEAHTRKRRKKRKGGS